MKSTTWLGTTLGILHLSTSGSWRTSHLSESSRIAPCATLPGDVLWFAKTPHEAILIHVTCYTASFYIIDFTRALDFGEAQVYRLVSAQASHGGAVEIPVGFPNISGIGIMDNRTTV